ncbi:hypothetical protein PO870_27565 [Rhizobium sp. MJ37]|nr:hypothetical protein [Rhizobium sp. MJ37]MDC9837136.1 hypothetical protein [Rhizobium sp. MJ37]
MSDEAHTFENFAQNSFEVSPLAPVQALGVQRYFAGKLLHCSPDDRDITLLDICATRLLTYPVPQIGRGQEIELTGSLTVGLPLSFGREAATRNDPASIKLSAVGNRKRPLDSVHPGFVGHALDFDADALGVAVHRRDEIAVNTMLVILDEPAIG